MIPLRDTTPSQTTPVVNIAIIVLCAGSFLLQLADDSLTERFGMIPARVSHPERPVLIPDARPVRTPFGVELVEVARPAAKSWLPPLLTLLTCIFLHGGWLHFLGNMWFLWIFGDNVEDRLGHRNYVLFYLGCGIAASLAHYLTQPSSPVPTIGASGAIAGVMGAYLILYPRGEVVTLVPIFYFMQIMVLPASIFLGLWFLLQFFQGALALGSAQTTGVAWWAHIGGFVVGAAVGALLRSRRPGAPPGGRYVRYRVR